MSRALNYLLKARPEAMQAYFAFLRDNGSRLDDKTRILISIITKVAVQTDGGLRQYTRQAIRLGVSGDEILDALLMAFPALGLSKIVWAIDIFLDMDLAEFSETPAAEEAQWHFVIERDRIPADGVTTAEIDGRALFISADDGQVNVFDAHCPHQDTNLVYSKRVDMRVECAMHGWQFDLKTGNCIRFGNKGLKKYEHKFDEERLMVRW
jgi:nitrite reductase/ring-hydroxylating ferredoxin subunit/alkylhydroperoxidase/carboxymuconolactone decarboxylase family protein YurZ